MVELFPPLTSHPRGLLACVPGRDNDCCDCTKMLVPRPPTMITIDDALAVKEALSLESFVVTLRKLDGRDKFTKVGSGGQSKTRRSLPIEHPTSMTCPATILSPCMLP